MMSKNGRKDPLEETQANPELPDLMAARMRHRLAHLSINASDLTEAGAQRGAARAALVYAAVMLTVVVLVAARLLAQPHGGS